MTIVIVTVIAHLVKEHQFLIYVFLLSVYAFLLKVYYWTNFLTWNNSYKGTKQALAELGQA